MIVESWQNGCPVLISDQTPWQDLENKLIGKVYPLSQNANFVKAEEAWTTRQRKLNSEIESINSEEAALTTEMNGQISKIQAEFQERIR